MKSLIRQTPGQRLQHRHPDCHAHLDLLTDQALRAIRHIGRDFDAAIHRAGCMTSASGLARLSLARSSP